MSTPSLSGRYVARRIWPFTRGKRAVIGGGFVALLAEVGLRLIEPWPLALIVDRVTGSEGTSPIAWLDELSAETFVIVAAAAFIAIGALRALTSYLSTVAFAVAGTRVVTKLRAALFAHVQRLSLSWHTQARSGDLLARITADVGRLQDVSVTAALPLVGHTFAMLGMVGVMLLLNWPLALLALIAIPAFLLLGAKRSRAIKTVSRKQRRIEGALATSASEVFGAISVVQANSLEPLMDEAFEVSNRQSLRDGVKAKRLAAGLERRTDVVIAIATGLVLATGGRAVLSGELSPGELVIFVLYLRSAYRPLRDIAKYTGRLARALASAERIVEVIDTVPEIQDQPNARPAPRLRGAVTFETVSFAYDTARPVLRDVSVQIAPGETVALVGASGAGKSSFVSLLLRLYEPQEGRVLLDGHDIRKLTLDSLRAQIAIVLQDGPLFGTTVRENIAHGAPGASDAEILHAAHIANAHEFILALPDGYDTVLGERGSTLSGGQRQRIAIARAALRRAPILILDEPTTGLDAENAQAVTQALARLSSDATSFVIAHDAKAISHVDRVLLVDGARVIEQAGPANGRRSAAATFVPSTWVDDSEVNGGAQRRG